MSITKSLFGKTNDGNEVYAYTLERANSSARIIEFGARVSKFVYDGVSVVCGFDNMEGYIKDGDFHGAIVGRYANRIFEGKFKIDGVEYNVSNNEKGRYHLHGGFCGYSGKLWSFSECKEGEGFDSVTLKYTSPDGEEGFPGELTLYVTYTLTNSNELIIDYSAVSNKDTIMNFTNHSYFNLSGVGGTILDHELYLNCAHYIPVDVKLIPYGTIDSVSGTPFDFTTVKAIGQDIAADDVQIKMGGGYDHCFVRDNAENKEEAQLIGSIYSPVTGINMDILTTEGGIQMYTGNFMKADNPFFESLKQHPNCAVALECNRIPDSPNHEAFPSCIYRAGEEYTQRTVYKFSKK